MVLKKGVPIMFLKIIQDVYDEARTSICGEIEDFTVKVGVLQRWL